MSETIGKPFTKAEMEAMRRATQEESGLKADFWAKLKRVGGKIPFAEDLVAAYLCAFDPATPNRVRFVLMAAIAYFILPVDGISDFLPLLGFADDAAIIAAAIAKVAGSMTDEHRRRAREILGGDL